MTPKQKVFEYLKAHPGASTKDISEGTRLDMKQVGNAITHMKTNNTVRETGKNGILKCWEVTVAELGKVRAYTRREPTDAATPRASKVQRDFEKAMDALMNAWLEVRNHITSEIERRELDELREFKAGIMASVKRK
jgi:hypothetical protein